jgi:hypothetical protein
MARSGLTWMYMSLDKSCLHSTCMELSWHDRGLINMAVFIPDGCIYPCINPISTIQVLENYCTRPSQYVSDNLVYVYSETARNI